MKKLSEVWVNGYKDGCENNKQNIYTEQVDKDLYINGFEIGLMHWNIEQNNTKT